MAATRNQALNALVFLYKEVLKLDLGPLDALRAKRREYLPRLSLKNTAFEGEAEARWTRVTNVSYYEVKAWNSTTGDSPDTIPWETVPVIPVCSDNYN